MSRLPYQLKTCDTLRHTDIVLGFSVPDAQLTVWLDLKAMVLEFKAGLVLANGHGGSVDVPADPNITYICEVPNVAI